MKNYRFLLMLGSTIIDQTNIDERSGLLAMELFKEFGHDKHPQWEQMYARLEEETND